MFSASDVQPEPHPTREPSLFDVFYDNPKGVIDAFFDGFEEDLEWRHRTEHRPPAATKRRSTVREELKEGFRKLEKLMDCVGSFACMPLLIGILLIGATLKGLRDGRIPLSPTNILWAIGNILSSFVLFFTIFLIIIVICLPISIYLFIVISLVSSLYRNRLRSPVVRVFFLGWSLLLALAICLESTDLFAYFVQYICWFFADPSVDFSVPSLCFEIFILRSAPLFTDWLAVSMQIVFVVAGLILLVDTIGATARSLQAVFHRLKDSKNGYFLRHLAQEDISSSPFVSLIPKIPILPGLLQNTDAISGCIGVVPRPVAILT
jgi:hypothetical protein